MEREFFKRGPEEVARDLLGGTLGVGEISGRIVETEAYSSVGDEACHTFFRKKARAFVAAQRPGAAYVYLNYGVHWMMNFLVCGADGVPGFVLVRALEPLQGLDAMRSKRRKVAEIDLCSGPGKLTQALGIDGRFHGKDLCDGRGEIWIEVVPGNRMADDKILVGRRIGITRGIETLWRFGLKSSHLSREFSE